MLDFVKICLRNPKKDDYELYPKFLLKKSKDLMIRGNDFYAVWLEDRGVWSTDEDDLIRTIDDALSKESKLVKLEHPDVKVKYMFDSDSGSIDRWHKYCQRQQRDSFTMLDEKLIFSNTDVRKEDYASKRLNYPLEEGDYSAWDKLVGTLYSPEERHKLEWSIGSIVTGDSKTLQKFVVLYGAAGTGKSTVLNIIQKLFDGYYSVFDAKALGSSNASFALEPFNTNPLVAIQHDGDLSRIEDNTRLNSLVSHEIMTVNEKFKSAYQNRFKAFLFMGTNKPVKITDGKSGLLRRLIDIRPSGEKLGLREYNRLMKQVDFELGAIAWHCREVYLEDPEYYDDYVPTGMLDATNDFYNFVVDSYHIFKDENGVSLRSAWELYKVYCEDSKVSFPYSKRIFKDELKNYFKEYYDTYESEDGKSHKCYYFGFKEDKFVKKNTRKKAATKQTTWLELKELNEGEASIFDEYAASFPGQYATKAETPMRAWTKVKTKLADIDTSKLHYVKVPENHIVIDFDIKGKDGKKLFEKNLEAASKWPKTYAEVSKSGEGMHLHYIYKGDTSKLVHTYDENIEVKTFPGDSSLRRKLTKCVNLPISEISSGLPLKGDDKVINWDGAKNEKAIRTIIKRNLNKEYSPNTAPSVQYIYKTLEEAYDSGIEYDVSDLENAVAAFALTSTNQADKCLKLVNRMHFHSDEADNLEEYEDKPIVFFDVEVMPNMNCVCWKVAGKEHATIQMINPKPKDIEDLLKFKLVGFNCRRYDNHILHAILMGYNVKQVYNLSQRIINSKKGENRDAFFGVAYNYSYTDIFDFAAKKQSLKKWEIELGEKHHELGLKWDEDVPEEMWETVADYCCDDVIATEAVFDHLKGDWTARQILADLAGMTVNDTTNTLTTRIIFGTERHPELIYTDLKTGERTDGTHDKVSFPDYEYVDGKNMYRGVDIGYGGYVYAEPGMYGNVALLDVASMHPSSAINLNAFGKYTDNFKDILDARIAIKHGDYESVRHMFDGKLAKYLGDESTAKDLAQALKIAINSVYGLTSANFDNPFRDIRNKNNIVALRGALFMKTLQDEVAKRGFTVAHIKTDSIKIPDATPEIIEFCMKFAKEYGYTFEHEATYDRMCLVNNAVYIAKYKDADECRVMYGYIPEKNRKKGNEWTATGKQFAVPYVFKTLFSKEPISMNDLRETFSVKSALYLDVNESLADVSAEEKELDKLESKYKKGKLSDTIFEAESAQLVDEISKGHDYHFVGKVGEFTPVKSGHGGGILCREQNGKMYAATGTTGYRWIETEILTKKTGRMVGVIDEETGEEKQIAEKTDFGDAKELVDMGYYHRLADDAIDAIAKFGNYEWFVSDDPYIPREADSNSFMNIPIDADEEIPF